MRYNNELHQQLITPTTDYTNNGLRQQLITPTTDYTNNELHQQRITPTTDYTNNWLHRKYITKRNMHNVTDVNIELLASSVYICLSD